MSFTRKICFCFLLLSVFCNAQQNESLPEALQKMPDDTNKINALTALSRQNIITGDYEKAMGFATQAKVLSEQLNFKPGLATVHSYYGLVYYGWGNYPQSLKNYFTSLRIREELNDKKGVAATYHNIGNTYYSLKNRDQAMKNFQSSLKIKRELHDTLDTHFAHTINNIGNYYHDKGNAELAIVYYNKALELEHKLNDQVGIISSYNNLANIYVERKEFERAERSYIDALKIEETLGDKEGISALYTSLGNLYYMQLKLDKAKDYVTKGLELAREVGSKEDIKLSYGVLTDIEKASGNYKKALELYKMYYDYSDSIKSEEIVSKSIQEQLYYEFSKKEALAKAEQDKKDVQHLEQSNQQRLIIYSAILGLVIVLVFSVFLYNRFRLISQQKSIIEKQKEEVEAQRQLANERTVLAEQQKKVIEEKQKEIIDSIHYAKRIQTALITSEKYIQKNIDKLKK
ncbi:MAG: protein serine/threonine phosphatase [Bacteroidetes bacterium]|jgi:tetratricopeptide (TPR) repeat protein|nr:protein serine/threonine phosphatase [Bacteroidota bacterium]